jgi:hypothetical protein
MPTPQRVACCRETAVTIFTFSGGKSAAAESAQLEVANRSLASPSIRSP